jgi:glycerophosphoryl diester phosphodiesterase
LDPKMTLIIGHRGSPKKSKENTMGSFEQALKDGADGFELDVWPTADGVLVVHHDRDYKAIPIPETCWQQDLGLVRLDEILATFRDCYINIEIKTDKNNPAVGLKTAHILAKYLENQTDKILVSSFGNYVLTTLKSLTKARLGYLSFDSSAAISYVPKVGISVLCLYDKAITLPVVKRAGENNLEIWAWTIDDPERIRELADCGIHAIITNVPETAFKVLKNSV